MNIPKFWSKATAQTKLPAGERLEFTCWRSADASEADAHDSAVFAAKRVLETFLAGGKLERYAYGRAPLREEITHTLYDAQGRRVAVVTRNRSGVLVLNTERVLFVDIDFPRIMTGATLLDFLGRLFGRAGRQPATDHEQNARARVEEFVAARPGWNMRLYRTRGGLRGIATHALFQAQSDQSQEILRQLGSDPLYVRLCQVQACFRARLTPKPWRCGHHNNTFRYPLEKPDAVEGFAQWVAEYDARHRHFATCRLLGEVGSGEVHPEVQQVIELHDFATKCHDPLELA